MMSRAVMTGEDVRAYLEQAEMRLFFTHKVVLQTGFVHTLRLF